MAGRQKVGGGTRRVLRRSTRGNIKLWVPRDRVYAFCRRKKLGNLDLRNGWARPQFLDSSVAEIIVAYSSEFRGFANYYAIADGVKGSLDNLELIVIRRSAEHTSELQSLMRTSYAVLCWKKKQQTLHYLITIHTTT